MHFGRRKNGFYTKFAIHQCTIKFLDNIPKIDKLKICNTKLYHCDRTRISFSHVQKDFKKNGR